MFGSSEARSSLWPASTVDDFTGLLEEHKRYSQYSCLAYYMDDNGFEQEKATFGQASVVTFAVTRNSVQVGHRRAASETVTAVSLSAIFNGHQRSNTIDSAFTVAHNTLLNVSPDVTAALSLTGLAIRDATKPQTPKYIVVSNSLVSCAPSNHVTAKHTSVTERVKESLQEMAAEGKKRFSSLVNARISLVGDSSAMDALSKRATRLLDIACGRSRTVVLIPQVLPQLLLNKPLPPPNKALPPINKPLPRIPTRKTLPHLPPPPPSVLAWQHLCDSATKAARSFDWPEQEINAMLGFVQSNGVAARALLGALIPAENTPPPLPVPSPPFARRSSMSGRLSSPPASSQEPSCRRAASCTSSSSTTTTNSSPTAHRAPRSSSSPLARSRVIRRGSAFTDEASTPPGSPSSSEWRRGVTEDFSTPPSSPRPTPRAPTSPLGHSRAFGRGNAPVFSDMPQSPPASPCARLNVKGRNAPFARNSVQYKSADWIVPELLVGSDRSVRSKLNKMAMGVSTPATPIFVIEDVDDVSDKCTV